MLRAVPQWVTDIRREIEQKVYEQSLGYGIPATLIQDSISINRSIDNIADHLETLYYRSNKKPDSILGMNGIKFGELRKKKRK